MAAAVAHTNRDIRPSADNTKTLPFECTYPKCVMRFATLGEMKAHKKNEPNHYYCKKCDVDCKDWDDLTQHKVTAMSPWVDGPMKGNRDELPKHIVCEFCGIEYKTFGARRVHREQNHPADQNITCPLDECKIIFVKAADFVRHFEDGRCEGVSAGEFRAYLEQVHVNKQIMQDTIIAERVSENKRAAMIAKGVLSDDADTEGGGVALSDVSSIMDGEEHVPFRPLVPDYDLLSFDEPRSPGATSSSSVLWSPGPSAPLAESMRGMSLNPKSRAPSIEGTDLSAREYASRISGFNPSSKVRSIYDDSFPSLRSPSYTPSVTSETGSNTTASARGQTQPAWTTGPTSRLLFPNAQSTPTESDFDDEDAVVMVGKDMRTTRWWDPDHEEFEPDCFRNKDLMETKTFSCPFADCEDNYGYDSLDVLKAHIRHAHLDLEFRCPCCKKRFARPSALMAHTEANGNCKVQGSVYFKGLIADISGGFLKAKRLPVPKIYNQKQAIVLANGKVVNGVMPTEFQPKLPKALGGK